MGLLRVSKNVKLPTKSLLVQRFRVAAYTHGLHNGLWAPQNPRAQHDKSVMQSHKKPTSCQEYDMARIDTESCQIMIKYIGSKRLLLPIICDVVDAADSQTVLDLFSGTSRVGHALKKRGKLVTANDYNNYAYKLALTYVAADARVMRPRMEQLLKELNALPGKPGYFTETFCIQSRFFQPHNGERVDAIREHIHHLHLRPEERAACIASLMEAADRVDSTCGLQMAYLKDWSDRSYNELELRMPDMVDGIGWARQGDAIQMVEDHGTGGFDLVYIDPPYNQHSYLGNYHIWETLALWDKPQHYGKACKRVECKDKKSPFNSKKKARAAFERMVDALGSKYVLVSGSNEGFLTADDIVCILSERWEVGVISVPYKRYVGAQIGIYNNDGKAVGEKGKLHNVEHLFLAGPDASKIVESMGYTLEPKQ